LGQQNKKEASNNEKIMRPRKRKEKAREQQQGIHAQSRTAGKQALWGRIRSPWTKGVAGKTLRRAVEGKRKRDGLELLGDLRGREGVDFYERSAIRKTTKKKQHLREKKDRSKVGAEG